MFKHWTSKYSTCLFLSNHQNEAKPNEKDQSMLRQWKKEKKERMNGWRQPKNKENNPKSDFSKNTHSHRANNNDETDGQNHIQEKLHTEKYLDGYWHFVHSRFWPHIEHMYAYVIVAYNRLIRSPNGHEDIMPKGQQQKNIFSMFELKFHAQNKTNPSTEQP